MTKKRFAALRAVIMGVCAFQVVCLHAQPRTENKTDRRDSVNVTLLDEVEIYATRANSVTPIAHSELTREQIQKLNLGQDVPFMLTMSPSVVATSDAGAGIGYTGIRIRGVDASRINVTSNGVPMNDAESHSHFWVNIPDFASSIQDMQIQRGVGTSTNGSGAFGGSINITTEGAGTVPFAELAFSGGSFGTHRQSLKFGTGLIDGHWSFGARLSNIASDGYIDRAFARQKSFLAQGAYYGGGTVIKLIAFGGTERTYHAWDGVTREQIETYGRRFNPCGIIRTVVRDEQGRPVRDEYGNVVTENTGYYDDQTDNYTQYNYQLVLNQRLGEKWKLNATLHYTDGRGYYEEYRDAQRLMEYRLVPFAPADADKEPWLDEDGNVDRSNLVRRKHMDNGFGGIVFAANHTAGRTILTIGGAVNHYGGEHFGNVIWIENYSGPLNPKHEYYRNETSKLDANIYAKINWQFTDGVYLYGDMQYRQIRHRIEGTGDIWDYRPGHSGMQIIDIDKNYSFFNPKAGLYWTIDANNTLYGSVAVAHKEPTRNNHIEAAEGREPRPERLTDYELGYKFNSGNFIAVANVYYMDYKDQLVLTGRLNDIGEAVSENVRDSYRAGIELQAGVKITDWLRWDANATFSRNRIMNHRQYYDIYDADYNPLPYQQEITFDSTDISFSPSLTAGNLITFSKGGFEAMLHTQYVGSQYVTNTSNGALKLDDYCVTNLRVSYTFALGKIKRITANLSFNNIFNKEYSSNGWGAEWFVQDAAGGAPVVESLMGYYPQATFNVLAGITLRF